MTVKDAKLKIIEVLEDLRLDGIVVQEIRIGWTAELPANVAKPEAKMKCSISFVADL